MTEAPPDRRPPFSPFVLAVILAAGAAVSAASSLIVEQRRTWERHAAKEAEEIQWVLFLKDDADKAPIEEALKILPGLRALRFVSKDEALDAVKADPVLSDGLSLTGSNPFPASFSVQWDPLFIRGDLLEQHAKRLASLPGVDRVDYDRPRVDRFAVTQKALAQMGLAVETLRALGVALLLLLAGRILFFTAGPMPFVSLAASAAAGAAGAAGGVYGAGALGLSPSLPSFLAGAAAAGVLALGREALTR